MQIVHRSGPTPGPARNGCAGPRKLDGRTSQVKMHRLALHGSSAPATCTWRVATAASPPTDGVPAAFAARPTRNRSTPSRKFQAESKDLARRPRAWACGPGPGPSQAPSAAGSRVHQGRGSSGSPFVGHRRYEVRGHSKGTRGPESLGCVPAAEEGGSQRWCGSSGSGRVARSVQDPVIATPRRARYLSVDAVP
jgi:hypothetical protein